MTERTDTRVVPVIGCCYEDIEGGRVLEVVGVNPGDPLGRDVVGIVSYLPRNGHAPKDYATDLRTFAAYWRPQ